MRIYFKKQLLLAVLLCSSLLISCTKVEPAKNQDSATTEEEDSTDKEVDSSNETAGAKVEEEATQKSVNEEEDQFTLYLNLLMMTLDDADKALEEEAVKNEDESFDFVKHGVRVWLHRGYISQVLLMNSDVSINGAHVGDDLQKFIDVFGEPSQDVNGEAHFSYELKFLVVQYDITTGKTVAVYLLSEDYGTEESYLQ